NGPVASLALLTFGDDHSVKGKQVVRNGAGMRWLDLQGDCAFDGGKIGTLTLISSVEDSEGNIQAQSMHYRFAISSSRIQAIRIDGGILSTATMVPAQNDLSGSFLFAEMWPEVSSSRVVEITVDQLGNVTGTSVVRHLSEVNVSNLS